MAVNELRVKGPIMHTMVGGGVGTHRESYDYDADAEGRAAQCEEGLMPAGSSGIGAGELARPPVFHCT